MSQKEHSKANQKAWSYRAYEAAVRLGGMPDETAQKLRKNPEHTLRDYLGYLGNVKGKKIANLLGSTGKKAIALSLLGAQVTVVDITKENQRYALECAKAAGISLDYIVSDVLEWPTEPFLEHFDLVLMELGILHYFVNLQPLIELVRDILAPEGKFILHEFHPVIKKCRLKPDGNQWILEGDYFSDEIIEASAPRTMAFPDEEADAFPKGCYRYWQLGEIVTALGLQGLMIETLVENPHKHFCPLPETFTIVARKIG